MADPFWGALQKSGVSTELIEAAIERIFHAHNFNTNTTIWGMLPKALDDDETILEAIAALIAAHEADEAAHLGVGESLQSHRASEIIDHLVGSVLGDKYSNKEYSLNLPFESLDKYVKSVAGVESDIAGYRLVTGGTINTLRYLRATAQYSQFYWNIGLDATFQFIASIYSTNNYTAYVTLGGDILSSDPPSIGFKFINGAVYAVEGVWAEVYTEYSSLISGIDPSVAHIYRVQYVAAENTAYFFVDGVLKTSLILHTNDDVGLVMFSSCIKNTYAADAHLSVGGIYVSINPFVAS